MKPQITPYYIEVKEIHISKHGRNKRKWEQEARYWKQSVVGAGSWYQGTGLRNRIHDTGFRTKDRNRSGSGRD